MPCNNKCNELLKVGSYIYIKGSDIRYLILSIDLSYADSNCYVILQKPNGKKLFATRRKFLIRCHACPNRN